MTVQQIKYSVSTEAVRAMALYARYKARPVQVARKDRS